MNSGNKFNVAIYLRLSRDDADFKDESQSISNQRDYIASYIRNNDDFIIIDEYVDDGYTGSNFERPAFKRLLTDIEHKKINCIIVKDQSRFGRNDLVPYYIRNYFPINRVRFIAINLNVDTFDENASGNKLIGINSYVDTRYCEDTSEKVKSTIYTKKREGKHLGGTAIYGYKKDPQDKYKIVIDENVAPVVRRIFEMFASGQSLQMICRTLDSENIPIPSVYKNLNRGNKSSFYGHWCTRTIGEMLTNEVYIGNMCQCKNRRPAVSVKKTIRNPKEKWIIVENTHEPIIDKETFDIVQNIFEKNRNITRNTQDYLFKGFMVCKECGHTIGINKNGNGKGYCVCNYYRKTSKLNLCSPHSMPYEDLESAILKEVKKVMKKANKELVTNSLKATDRTLAKINQLEKENLKLKQLIDEAQTLDSNAYIDSQRHIITIETYFDVHNRIMKEKEQNKIKLQENIDKINDLREQNQNKDYESVINDYLSLKKPNRKVLSNLIDKIVIDENKNIEIIYRIKAPI